MHIIIVGPRHIGKSTLLRRVLRELNCSYGGYLTKKEDELADAIHGSPVYLYEIGKPATDRQLLGYCKSQVPEAHKAAFDGLVPMLQTLPQLETDALLLDEIGFMETVSEDFCQGILHLLDADKPILAAVKDKVLPFLQAVRAHPNCRCFYLTAQNRDSLYQQVLAFARTQLSDKQAL